MGKARLSYFKSKGDDERVNELTTKIKGIEKEIEDALKLLTKAKEQKAKEKHIEKFTKFKSLLNI